MKADSNISDDFEQCPNCNRRFFTGRMSPHLKFCKDKKPYKPIIRKQLANIL